MWSPKQDLYRCVVVVPVCIGDIKNGPSNAVKSDKRETTVYMDTKMCFIRLLFSIWFVNQKYHRRYMPYAVLVHVKPVQNKILFVHKHIGGKFRRHEQAL